RDKHSHAGRSRDEILNGQTEHLSEITQGGFPAIRLPVRIGHETCSRAEGQHGHPVILPVHFIGWSNTAESIYGPFHRTEETVPSQMAYLQKLSPCTSRGASPVPTARQRTRALG